MTVLLVEDNPEIQIIVRKSLEPRKIVNATTLAEAHEKLERISFSLVILDIHLPDGDGVQFYSNFKNKYHLNSLTPVIILTGSDEIDKKIDAFNLGVDDFVQKPFNPRELRARVEARIQKSLESDAKSKTGEITFNDLVINKNQQKVWIKNTSNEVSVFLTPLEFRLLSFMTQFPEVIHTRDVLMKEVWGKGVNITVRTIDTHISHLRKKIEMSSVTIESIFGQGYRISKKSSTQVAA